MAVAQAQLTAAPPSAFHLAGFVLRSPLLPATDFIDLATHRGDADWASETGYSRGVGSLRQRLRDIVAKPEVAEALFIASPSLVQSIPIWLDDPLSVRAQRVERSLIKYLARMSTRPTPFGLFSGCSVGRFGDVTRLWLESRDRYGRHSRLDMDYLFSLTEVLNRDAGLRSRLRFRPNDTIVALGGRYRYVEQRIVSGNKRQYILVDTEATPYLEHILQRSANGAGIDDLIYALQRYDEEITPEEAREYLTELIDGHLLVSMLQPPITGREPAGELAAQLKELGQLEIAESLQAAIEDLGRIDAAGLGSPASVYTGVATRLEALAAPVEPSRLVQVDMHKAGDLMLGPEVRLELERYASALARFGSSSDPLADFRAAFEKRYGTATMPLLHVLDEEAGIGLGNMIRADESPLLAGLQLNKGGFHDSGTTWRQQHEYLLERLHDVWVSAGSEIVIDNADAERLMDVSGSAPPAKAFAIGFTLAARSAEAIDRGDFLIFFRGIFGPSGARILGRFCHVSPEIDALVREHLNAEERQEPDAIFAEIVHLPEGRVGNVILRPVLRQYELTFMGRSGASEDSVIPISDLLVSVRGGRTLLWSARLGKRVVPRLTTAHSFTQPGTLTPYRFLAHLQTEGIRGGFGFGWGPLAKAPYLPRVRWGRCLLSKATWHIEGKELKEAAKLSGRDRYRAVRNWADGRRILRLVHLVDGDNELLVDFDNPISVDALLDLVKNRPSFTLAEMFPGSDDLCVAGPEGRFTHEIYVPVVAAAHLPTPQVPPVTFELNQAALRMGNRHRSMAPGGHWLFAKIYGGPTEIDRVLCEIVAPLVSRAFEGGSADRWFFIRYADPNHHLRLRFRGDPKVLHGDLLVQLNQAVTPRIEAGTLSGMQLDVYQPEIERYGGPIGLDLSEQVFQADSEAVIDLLQQLDGDASGVEARSLLALRGLVELLEDFATTEAEMRTIIERRREECAAEFNADASPLRHRLGDRYRAHRAGVQAVLDRERDALSELAPGLAVWAKRSTRVRPLAASLRNAEEHGTLWTPVSLLIDRYLHLYVNRLARLDGKMHELIMFEFLSRHYKSRGARARKANRLTDEVSS